MASAVDDMRGKSCTSCECGQTRHGGMHRAGISAQDDESVTSPSATARLLPDTALCSLFQLPSRRAIPTCPPDVLPIPKCTFTIPDLFSSPTSTAARSAMSTGLTLSLCLLQRPAFRLPFLRCTPAYTSACLFQMLLHRQNRG